MYFAFKKYKERRRRLAPQEAAEKKRRRSYRWKIIFGLFGPFALQALDATVIASAFSYIATDFSTYPDISSLCDTPSQTKGSQLIVTYRRD
jgi:hypothetical protein